MEPTWASNPYYQQAIARFGRHIRDGRLAPDKIDELNAVTKTFADKEAASRVQYIINEARKTGQDKNLALMELNALGIDDFWAEKQKLKTQKQGLPWNIGLGLANAALMAKQGYDQRQRDRNLTNRILGLRSLYKPDYSQDYRDM